MGKLLNFLDNHILKIGVSFLIAFIALYPKLPSINIKGTWVYIRLEDFFIAAVVVIWLIQLFRKKVSIPIKLGLPIGAYWLAGLASLIFSLIVIAPQLSNFYPNVAIFSYLRRIEYMILFFVAFSTIKSIKDLKHYLVVLFLTVVGVIIYGFGQRLYIIFWQLVEPLHLTDFFFCFPSFQTGNEEFAKGIPLCLSAQGRVTSTFAGQYDLGAYLVLLIPIILSLIFYFRKKLWKISFSILFLCSSVLLILTASRVSFIAYILSGIATLTIIKKKIFIPVFLVVSFIILTAFSQSTAKRFMQTFGFASVVIDSQGRIIGETLSPELQKKLSSQKVILENVVDENLPRGTSYLGLPEFKKEKTDVALIKEGLTTEEAKKLKLEIGGVELSTVSGNFLVKKALVLDVSLTTRLQAEWPRAIEAFSQNFLLGSGFATITLATDNDYLRLLGETGLLGLITFSLIFLVFGVTAKDIMPNIKSAFVRAFLLGMFGGLLGILINAGLIDVFESSKVAETLWILLGIAMGVVYLHKKKEIDYRAYFVRIFSSSYFLLPLSFLTYLAIFAPTVQNFFVGDDFSWLRWAASSTVSDIPKYFTQAQGFFYRPIDKTVFFGIFSLFGFKPEMYHLFLLIIHFLSGVGVYLLSKRFLKKRTLAMLAASIFLILPSQFENLFWISTISVTLSTFFMLYGILAFIKFRENKNPIYLLPSIALGILALLTYEMSVVYFALISLCDIYLFKTKLSVKSAALYFGFGLLNVAYLFVRTLANSFNPSGDYSYSIVNFVPNTIGNFIGYLGLFIFGESFLPVYNHARSELKSEGFLVLAFVALGFVALAIVLFLNKQRLRSLYGNLNVKYFVFCALFIFVSLFPFLGLGNLSPRYGYLAAIGFSLALVYALNLAYKRFNKKYLLALIVVLVAIFYLYSLWNLNKQWQTAGKISNRTLSYLKLYYEQVEPQSTFYFSNVPIRYQNAWVFPVGLSDGIWFIYRDDSLNVVKTQNVDEAKRLMEINPGKSYIFEFDENYKVESYDEK